MKINWVKILLVSFVLLMFYIIFRKNAGFVSRSAEEINFISECRKDIELQEWKGIIIFKRLNRDNHNIPEIHMKPRIGNPYIISLSCYDKNMFQIVEVGDTLDKPIGEIFCKIYKKTDLIVFKPSIFGAK